MSALLPYLGLLGPLSICLAVVFWLFVLRFASSQKDDVVHERRVSRPQMTVISRI